MKEVRSLAIGNCIMCHAPPVSFAFASWTKLQDIAWNFRKPPEADKCSCKSIIQKHKLPAECVSECGHAILWGDYLAQAAGIDKDTATCSSLESVYPSHKKWRIHAQQAWEKYLDDNHVNMHIRDKMFDRINAWAEQQWVAHDGTPSQKKSESAMKLKDFGKSWVIHNEDHKATRTVAYCPALYCRLLEETFSDDKIWKPERVSPKDAVKHLQDMVPKATTSREKLKLC